jgi:hypothetical protein
VTKRWLKFRRGERRPDAALGCDERLDWGFYRWLWRYPKHHRPETLRLLRHASAPVTVLHNDREVHRFMAGLGDGSCSPSL